MISETKVSKKCFAFTKTHNKLSNKTFRFVSGIAKKGPTKKILHFVQNDSLMSFRGRWTCRRIYFLVGPFFYFRPIARRRFYAYIYIHAYFYIIMYNFLVTNTVTFQKTQKIFGYFGFFGYRGGERFGPKIFQKIAFFGPMWQKFLVQTILQHNFDFILYGVVTERKKIKIYVILCFSHFFGTMRQNLCQKKFLTNNKYGGGGNSWKLFCKMGLKIVVFVLCYLLFDFMEEMYRRNI